MQFKHDGVEDLLKLYRLYAALCQKPGILDTTENTGLGACPNPLTQE